MWLLHCPWLCRAWDEPGLSPRVTSSFPPKRGWTRMDTNMRCCWERQQRERKAQVAKVLWNSLCRVSWSTNGGKLVAKIEYPIFKKAMGDGRNQLYRVRWPVGACEDAQTAWKQHTVLWVGLSWGPAGSGHPGAPPSQLRTRVPKTAENSSSHLPRNDEDEIKTNFFPLLLKHNPKGARRAFRVCLQRGGHIWVYTQSHSQKNPVTPPPPHLVYLFTKKKRKVPTPNWYTISK